MNIGEFSALGREEQFKQAGLIAGVDASVFDGIWRTESSRGMHMLSPKGAKGHFGLMDTTRGVWEKRFGTTIDPMDFGQSLYTSAHTLKENMGRFKELPKALRAYNGGWDEAKWGNAETSAYAGLVLGMAPEDDSPSRIEAEADAPVKTPNAADLWDHPFQTATRPKAPGKLTSAAKATAALAASLAWDTPAPRANVDFPEALGAQGAQQEARQTEVENTTALDVLQAAASRSTVVAALKFFNRDELPIDPNFKFNEEQVKGVPISEDRLNDLRVSGSQREVDAKLADYAIQDQDDAVTFRKGPAWGIAASIVADLPGAFLTGGLATLGFRAAGVGSVALAQAGAKGAARAASAAEGVVGNVGATALLDALGENQTGIDYGLAVFTGPLNVLFEGRALGRAADFASEVKAAQAGLRGVLAEDLALTERAAARLGPDATPEEVGAMKETIKAEGIRAEQASHTAAVPDNRKMAAGPQDEADILPPEPLKVEPTVTAPDAPPPIPDFPDAVRVLPEGFSNEALARQVKLHSGGVLTPENWADLPTGVHLSPNLDKRPDLAKQVETLQELAQAYLPGARIVIAADNAANTKAAGNILSIGDTHMIRLGKSGRMDHTAMHEFGHAVYSHHAGNAPKELTGRMAAEFDKFLADVKARAPDAWESRWAVTATRDPKSATPTKYNKDKNEFFAEQFVKHLQSKALAGELGGRLTPKIIDRVVKGVEAVLKLARDLVGRKVLAPGKAADEFFTGVLEGAFAKRQAKELVGEVPEVRLDAVAKDPTAVPAEVAKSVSEMINDPIARQYGLHLLPMGTAAERAEAKQIIGLYRKASDPAYVVDLSRLSKLLSLEAFSVLSATSNIMLRSKNPVMRMAAIELIENGGGAAGRRSTAAIAQHMNYRAIMGNGINELDNSFKAWFKNQPGASSFDELMKGQGRKKFDRLVMEEIEQRGKTGTQADLGPNVRAAADAMEAAFERARLMQVDSKTIGWAALPGTSRGYAPHRMKSDAYRNLSQPQRNALHGELKNQFVTISGYDEEFSAQLASRYLDRVNARALGGFDSPMAAHQPGAADAIEDALNTMNLTRDEVQAMMKKHFAGAASFTKKRLKIDLTRSIQASDGTSFTLMDLYDTNTLSLLRNQAQRISGEAALARHGVMGKPGIALMRRAMGLGDQTQAATRKEIEAVDQVFAELMGEPIGTANKFVDRAVQFNSLASLGGMGFNQLGEIINAAATIGVRETLQSIAGFGRLRAEILAMAKGGKVDNPFLSSIETMGGADFGTDAYKMVMPHDNPDLYQNSMGAGTIAVSDKLLRSGLHLQGKLSAWRAIHSTQVRGVAEQIVLKAANAINTGKMGNMNLRDMGLDDDILTRLGRDVITVRDGKVVGFDITKAKDMEAAHSFIQGVHRGASQIIQGTFIGETGAYVHSSWLRMMAQFRNFSITAIDKQWNRQVGNRGLVGASALLLASMSVAAPIYMARTWAASVGRDDQEEYLKKHLTPLAIARATTNYVASAGLGGDFWDAAVAITGQGEVSGGRSGTNQTLVGNLVAPVAGKVDKVWGAVQDTREGTDVMGLAKQLPFARLPFLIPVMNSLSK